MLGLSSPLVQPGTVAIVLLPHRLPPYFLRSPIGIVRKCSRCRLLPFARNVDDNDRIQEPNEMKSEDIGGDRREDDGAPSFNFRWGDLLYPDPDNIVAVGLTGLLTWASVQVLWQLFFIAFAILLAALKYSFVAALLIFILITLL